MTDLHYFGEMTALCGSDREKSLTTCDYSTPRLNSAQLTKSDCTFGSNTIIGTCSASSSADTSSDQDSVFSKSSSRTSRGSDEKKVTILQQRPKTFKKIFGFHQSAS